MNMTKGTKTSEAGISSKSVLVFALNMIEVSLSLISDGLDILSEEREELSGEELSEEGEGPLEGNEVVEVDDLTNE